MLAAEEVPARCSAATEEEAGIRGYTTGIRGYTTGIRGYTTGIRGYTTGIRGYTTGIRGIRGYTRHTRVHQGCMMLGGHHVRASSASAMLAQACQEPQNYA